MAAPTLSDLLRTASDAREPSFTEVLGIAAGGVDPLGLRQLNFQLMDLVLPGLNNVARNIRPYVAIAWAWRRAAWCAKQSGLQTVKLTDLQDFVDRIEVIFAWSQFLRDAEADLPGRDFLAPLCSREVFEFGGKEWERWKDARKYSTALSAPVNYGPAVKTLGWIEASTNYRGAFVSSIRVNLALDEFEKALGTGIQHAAFCKLGLVTVASQDARAWGGAWNMDQPTQEEKRAMLACLIGSERSHALRKASACIAEDVSFRNGDLAVTGIRADLCGQPSQFVPNIDLIDVTDSWRALQMRQLFRLALEALLHWTTMIVSEKPRHTAKLADMFLLDAGNAPSTEEWINADGLMTLSIPAQIDLLEDALRRQANLEELPRKIRSALAVSLSQRFEDIVIQSPDRLPLSRAKSEADSLAEDSPQAFLEHVLSSWIFGQHVYWSVGRGLGDARGRGKTILRLKVVPEEDGWTLAPGTNIRNSPRATPDRLDTAVNLLKQAGLFTA
jgi:hypothetical protein